MKTPGKSRTSDRKQRVAVELAALAVRGRLSPRRVVEWARAHRSSALHSFFQWDDSRAAEQYRIWQARELIVSVEVVHKDGRKRQVYVSPIVTRGKGGYVPLVKVLSNDDLRERFLAQALDDLRRIFEKYADLHELAGIRAAYALVATRREQAA